jgi:hypothetical protein
MIKIKLFEVRFSFSRQAGSARAGFSGDKRMFPHFTNTQQENRIYG